MFKIKLITCLYIIYGLISLSCSLNQTSTELNYQSPAEWAWNEHRTWTILFIAWISISGFLNIYFILNYCGLLYCDENQNSIRLRPTNDFIE